MLRVIASVALAVLVSCGAANARDKPISSCEKAPYLDSVRKQLPSYILETEATVPAKLKEKLKFKPGRLLQGTSRVCIVMAVSAAGKIEDAIVIYPTDRVLTPAQRNQILAYEMTPAEKDGHAVGSFSIMSITNY